MSINEFVYLSPNKALLADEIDYLSTPNNNEYLVSNSPSQSALVYAPEIDLYMHTSTQSDLDKAKAMLALYKARAIAYDSATDAPQSKQIGNKIILINTDKSLEQLLKSHGYQAIYIPRASAVIGSIGELCVIVDEYEIECDIVLHSAQPLTPYSGVYDISGIDDVLGFIRELSPTYHYTHHIDLSTSTCQLHKRRHASCTACVDTCHTGALMIDSDNALVMSQIDCDDCKECFGKCPTGAVQSTIYKNETFFEILELFDGLDVVLVDDDDLAVVAGFGGRVPFVVPKLSMLNKTHLLYLATSARSLQISKPHKDLTLVNTILEFYKLPKIGLTSASNGATSEISFVDKNTQTSASNGKTGAGNATSEIPLSSTPINPRLPSSELFAKRLELLHSLRPSSEILRLDSMYHISVNESSCTLCMSCVGACNLGAIWADGNAGVLYANDSLCVGCDYCAVSCAEQDTLSIVRGAVIDDGYFARRKVASDEPALCIECGTAYASAKAVEKIARIMTPKFTDPLMQKTLRCCTECKARLMMSKLAKEN